MRALIDGLPLTGSPVHAGIDLYTSYTRRQDLRFPRTRGDRPYKTVGADGKPVVPPYTRG